MSAEAVKQDKCALCYWKDIFSLPGCPATPHDALLLGFLMGASDAPVICASHLAGFQQTSESMQALGALRVIKTPQQSGASS